MHPIQVEKGATKSIVSEETTLNDTLSTRSPHQMMNLIPTRRLDAFA
jgi:hypothetical protein